MQQTKTDWKLFGATVTMVAAGLVMVYSASNVVADAKHGLGAYFLLRQTGWAVASLLVLMYMKKLDYDRLHAPAWAFGSLGVVWILLVAVYFADPRTHRWFRTPAGSIQPAEFAKPALILFLAWFVSGRLGAINNNRYTLAPAALVTSLLFFAVGVADLGTAIVLVATAAAVFYVAGLERRYFAIALISGGILIAGAILSKPYRLGRIIAYVDPEYKVISLIDPEGRLKAWVQSHSPVGDQTYQARQSVIAVGNGGVLGVGLMQGKQKLFYLPEAHTDFIYAVVSEELGLWGSTALLGGFLIILWRGMRLVRAAPDDFGRYLALGVTCSIVVQALINMSVALDLVPTKGIPLPMISYGGSSLLSTLIQLGFLLSVSEAAA